MPTINYCIGQVVTRKHEDGRWFITGVDEFTNRIRICPSGLDYPKGAATPEELEYRRYKFEKEAEQRSVWVPPNEVKSVQEGPHGQ